MTTDVAAAEAASSKRGGTRSASNPQTGRERPETRP